TSGGTVGATVAACRRARELSLPPELASAAPAATATMSATSAPWRRRRMARARRLLRRRARRPAWSLTAVVFLRGARAGISYLRLMADSDQLMMTVVAA